MNNGGFSKVQLLILSQKLIFEHLKIKMWRSISVKPINSVSIILERI